MGSEGGYKGKMRMWFMR